MESLNHLLLVGALILLVALLLGAASSRVRQPFLLVFLVAGMIAAEDRPAGFAISGLGPRCFQVTGPSGRAGLRRRRLRRLLDRGDVAALAPR